MCIVGKFKPSVFGSSHKEVQAAHRQAQIPTALPKALAGYSVPPRFSRLSLTPQWNYVVIEHILHHSRSCNAANLVLIFVEANQFPKN